MRQFPLLIGAILALVSTGCPDYECRLDENGNEVCTRYGATGAGGTSTTSGSSPGSGPSSGAGGDGNSPNVPPPSPPTACAAGAACLPGAPFCCSFNESLACAGGVYAHMAWCNGEGESCDPIGGGCSCPPGATRCIPEAPTHIQTCLPAGGKYQFQASPCPAYQYCNTTSDQCTSCLDECILGDVRCSDDNAFVERCKKLGAAGCNAAVWVIDYSCADKNMFCSKPTFTPSSNLDYCVNECGGRGIILQASECSLDPNVPCSILYCNASTGKLEGDHTACLGAGATCFADDQCASCNCTETGSTSGVCIGNTAKPCPTKNPCPW